jgi:hypothetical protein
MAAEGTNPPMAKVANSVIIKSNISQ